MEVKVAAVMTAARYEHTWCRTQIEAALNKKGIPLTVSGGVYYGQCMQKMLESLCDTDCEYALTIDGDSVFTPDHIQRLLDVAAQEQSIDALAAYQIRRGLQSPLLTHGQVTEIEIDGSPVKVTTAHFGLTVIKLDKLRSVSKPWFYSQPDENGSWNGNKLDCDIWFWHQWRLAGNSIYVDTECRIGHLEEVVSVADENLNVRHIYPADWSNHAVAVVAS
jgi:hypothetical protein